MFAVKEYEMRENFFITATYFDDMDKALALAKKIKQRQPRIRTEVVAVDYNAEGIIEETLIWSE